MSRFAYGTTARLFLPAMILSATALQAATAASELSVEVQGFRSSTGNALIAVCDSATYLDSGCVHRRRVQVAGESVEVVFESLPPGTYAVQVVHDENGNGLMDRNALGVPTEGYGFSRNPLSLFGPPDFADAAIRIGDGALRIEISLRYLFD